LAQPILPTWLPSFLFLVDWSGVIGLTRRFEQRAVADSRRRPGLRACISACPSSRSESNLLQRGLRLRFSVAFRALLLSAVTYAQLRPCALPHCFSLTVSASRLGEFTGVLTALTFTAIIFLADHKRNDHPRVEDTLIMFLAAFIALAVATYLFTGAAAEERQDYRAAFEAFCASMALSISLLLLFLGIAQLMRDQRFGTVARFAAGAGKWVVTLIVFLFMSLTAINGVGLYLPLSQEFSSAVAFGCGLLLIMLLGWIIALASSSSLQRWSKRGWPGPTRWATLALAMIGVLTVLTAVWSEQGTATSMPGVGYLALMTMLFFAAAGYVAQLTGIQQSPSGDDVRSDAVLRQASTD
jgi:hypothetical protein